MASQQEFMEGLQDLVRIGKTNGDVLTQEEIRSYFADLELNEQQMALVGAYMAENQIHIQGVIPAAVEEETEEIHVEEEPSSVYNMYIEEIDEISGLVNDSEDTLVALLEQGDEKAANQLLEMNLPEIVALAKQYSGKGIQMNDLIQEGNLALFCSISEYNRKEHGEFHSFVLNRAKTAMEDALSENLVSTHAGRKIAAKINQMNELATSMAKEFGREAKPEELADKMKISVEEVKELMKISLDAVNVLQGE